MNVFRASVFTRGDRPALYRKAASGRWEYMTWARYGRAVREVAVGLIDAGVAPKEAVAVPLEDSFERRILDLAVSAVGAVATVGGPDAGPLRDLAMRGAARDERDPDAFEDRVSAVTPDDVAIRDGDVTLTHANVLWGARSFTGAVPVTEEDRIVSDVPLVAHAVQVLTGAQAWLTDDGRAVGATVEVPARRVWGAPEAAGVLTVDARPLPGVTVRAGAGGELEARGPGIGRSPRVSDDGWLRTGTRGRIAGERVVLT